MRHQNARVENAGLENTGPICDGGKCGSGKCGTDTGMENAGQSSMESLFANKTAKANVGMQKWH